MGDPAESVVRAFLAAWKHPKHEELVAFFSDDAVYVDGRRGGAHRGIDAISKELEAQVAAIPGVVVEVKASLSDGSTVMIERVDHFDWQGRAVALEGVLVFEVAAGRITRMRDYYDQHSIAT